MSPPSPARRSARTPRRSLGREASVTPLIALAAVALAATLVLTLAAFAPAAAQENAFTYQAEGSAIEEGTSFASSAALTAAPVVLSPDADLQRALQHLIDYPDLAWEMHADGTGYVEIRIDTSGRVIEANVIEGWGFGLDEEVLEAVRQLHFSPARSGARPVEVVAQFPLTLTLD